MQASALQWLALTMTIPWYLPHANWSTGKVAHSTDIHYATPWSSPYPFLFWHCGLSIGSLQSCCHFHGSISWNYYTIPCFYNNSANFSVFPSFAPAATLRQPHTSSWPVQITSIISILKNGHIFTVLFQHSPWVGYSCPLPLHSPAICV